MDISVPATVADLLSVHDGADATPITTEFPAQLMARASVQVRNPSAAAREGTCVLQLDDGTAVRDMSQAYAFDMPPVVDYDAVVALSGAASIPPGTYNVALVCGESGSLSLAAVAADLSVWAAVN